MRWVGLVHLAFLLLPTCLAYYVRVRGQPAPGQLVFNASLGHGWTYDLDSGRTSKYVQRLVTVDHLDGAVRLRHGMSCPQTLVLFVECRSFRLSGSTTDYVSIPVTVHCSESRHEDHALSGDHQQVSTVVSVSTSEQVRSENETVVCFVRSQTILNVESLVPVFVRSTCEVKFHQPSDTNYGVESAGGDLVSRTDFCCPFGQWLVRLWTEVKCDPAEAPQRYGMELVFHLDGVSNELGPLPKVRRRGRREMRNLPPYFDRALYAVIVPEEKGKGYVVTTMSAKDPNGDEILYSLHAVMDARSQSMFTIDPVSGVVKTTVGLDREFMDVHYLKVTATDNGTPAKSGTATLQVSVADVNDHAPVFEQPTYEATIRESASVGSTVVTVRATDQDTGSNAK